MSLSLGPQAPRRRCSPFFAVDTWRFGDSREFAQHYSCSTDSEGFVKLPPSKSMEKSGGNFETLNPAETAALIGPRSTRPQRCLAQNGSPEMSPVFRPSYSASSCSASLPSSSTCAHTSLTPISDLPIAPAISLRHYARRYGVARRRRRCEAHWRPPGPRLCRIHPRDEHLHVLHRPSLHVLLHLQQALRTQTTQSTSLQTHEGLHLRPWASARVLAPVKKGVHHD